MSVTKEQVDEFFDSLIDLNSLSEKDFIKLTKRKAKRGHIESQVELAVRYYFGNSIKQNYNKSFYWYKKALDQGDKFAMQQLAWMYQQGLCGEPDYVKAFELYEESAKKGNSSSQYILGLIYSGEEKNFKKLDFDKAIYWFTKAAKKGDIIAENKIKMLKRNEEYYRRTSR